MKAEITIKIVIESDTRIVEADILTQVGEDEYKTNHRLTPDNPFNEMENFWPKIEEKALEPLKNYGTKFGC